MPAIDAQTGTGCLTPAKISRVFQDVTLNALDIDPQTDTAAYAKVRVEWPSEGQPAWNIDEDVCFLAATEQDDPYNRQRDETLADNGDGTLTKTVSYTRVWHIAWTLYGPNSFDQARALKSAMFEDAAHDQLAANNVFLVTDIAAPVRAPELFSGRWWERTDLSMQFNELVTETVVLNAVASVEVNVENQGGIVADITITKE